MRSTRTAVLVAALISAACRTEPKPEAQPPTVGWRPIVSFSGQGDSQTESFNIESGQFRIKWVTSHETSPGKGTFRVTVHSAVSGRPLFLAVEHNGVGSDTAYVNEDPRLFHLVVESSNLDWTINVEEAVIIPTGARHRVPEGHIISVQEL
jgi:hypothetical protein